MTFTADRAKQRVLWSGMNTCRRTSWMPLLAAVAALAPCGGIGAPPVPSPKLSSEEIAKAVKTDALSVPTGGELLAALNKVGKPIWQAQYRPPIPTAYTSRPQSALNLGGLIADGYIAVEAEDSQQVKNIGRDIVALAKNLGVSESVLRRGKSIEDFANNNEWTTLKEELDATQNEVKLAMEEMHDKDLIILMSLGAWIRGTEVVSGWIGENYTPAAAKLLRQPAIVEFLRNKINDLPEKVRGDSTVQTIHTKLGNIQEKVSFPRENTPTVEEVRKLKDSSSDLIRTITQK